MPNDLITLQALTNELNSILKDGRIDKIYQPNPLDIVLLIRAGGFNRQLLISSNPSMPRIHLTSMKYANPLIAPSFLMNLRKHLTGGHIEGVEILGDDRIISISVTSKTEMKDEVAFHLISEQMGRYSNLVLERAGIIVECIKHVSIDESDRYRIMMPNIPYSLPDSPDKFKLYQTEDIAAAIIGTPYDALPKRLYETVSGIAYSTAVEIVSESPISMSGNTTAVEAMRVAEEILSMRTLYASPNYKPCVLSDKNGIYTDYFVKPYRTLGNNYVCFDSVNEACDAFFSNKYDAMKLKGHIGRLSGLISKQITKLNKKLSLISAKLQDAESAEMYKNYADAIINCIYMIDRQAVKQSLTDYNVDPPIAITVPYDVRLSPSQNASKYYTKYNKLKRTRISNLEQKQTVDEALDYLNSIQYSIDKVESEKDIPDIEQELMKLDLIHAPKKSKKGAAYTPTEITKIEYEDFSILVGKNNMQNDKLTFELAEGADIWFHVKDYHGSHVLVQTGGRKVPDNVLLYAAKLAVENSAAASESKIAVDYTERKFVKRHPTGKTGLVTYVNFKTLIV